MNSSIYRFSLDLHSQVSQLSVPVVQGETSREFHITLTDGNIPYTIEDGCVALISILRPSGTVIQEFCIIENKSKIVYKFEQNESTAAEEGIHNCDVILFDAEGGILCAPKFVMVINHRVFNHNEIVPTAQQSTAIDAMLAKEADRQNEEEYRKSNEIYRVVNENSRLEAEYNRQNSYDALVHSTNQLLSSVNTAKDALAEVVRPITSADNGKFMRAKDGVAVWEFIDIAEEVEV